MGKRSALLRVKLYPDLDSVQASAQPTRYKKQHHTSPHSYSHCHSVTFLSLMLPGNLPLQSLASAATRTSCRICDQRNQRTLTEDSLKHSLCHCHYICIYRVSPKKTQFLEANISGLKAHIGESRTSFENCMFSAFIWPPKQVNSIPASLRKTGFKKLT